LGTFASNCPRYFKKDASDALVVGVHAWPSADESDSDGRQGFLSAASQWLCSAPDRSTFLAWNRTVRSKGFFLFRSVTVAHARCVVSAWSCFGRRFQPGTPPAWLVDLMLDSPHVVQPCPQRPKQGGGGDQNRPLDESGKMPWEVPLHCLPGSDSCPPWSLLPAICCSALSLGASRRP
jgi:hypothetical protein